MGLAVYSPERRNLIYLCVGRQLGAIWNYVFTWDDKNVYVCQRYAQKCIQLYKEYTH